MTDEINYLFLQGILSLCICYGKNNNKQRLCSLSPSVKTNLNNTI